MSKVRTRIAPSPTGFPHVGTAYIAYLTLPLPKRMAAILSYALKTPTKRAPPRNLNK